MDTIKHILSIILIILIAMVLAIFIARIRFNIFTYDVFEEKLSFASVTWCIVFFTLLLTFTISNFYNQYIDIRNSFITEIGNLQIIYMILKNEKGSGYVLKSIRQYIKSVIEDQLPLNDKGKYSEKTDRYHYKMNKNIIKYAESHPNLTNSLLLRVTSNEKNKRILTEVQNNIYLSKIVYFSFIFIIIVLCLVHVNDFNLQILVDFCFLSLAMLGLYLLYIFANPFNKSISDFPNSIYDDIVKFFEMDDIKDSC